VGCGVGDRPPYAGAYLIYAGFAQDQALKHYVRGKLSLAGIDLRVSAACWFDAAYAIIVEAPQETLEKMFDHLVTAQARMDPDRETWGALPEHRRLMERAVNTPPAPTNHRTKGNGRPM
jgi:hypothetical protein